MPPRAPVTDLVVTTWVTASSALLGYLPLQSYGRRVIAIAIQGPSNSVLRIYRGRFVDPAYLVSNVYPADNRLYDSLTGGAPITIQPGEVLTFAWTGGASGPAAAGTATVTSEVM